VVDRIQALINEHGIRTVRLEFADFYGILRGKAIPVERFSETITDGVQFAMPTFAIDLAGNVATGTGVAEEIGYRDLRAIPDLSTFGLLPWEPGTARVMADIYFEGRPVAVSPRQILKKVIDKYANLGLEPVVASELEFYLCRRQEGRWVRYVDRPSMVYTASRLSDPDDFAGRVRAALKEMGMEVLASNHEFFPSQYEINLAHLPALQAADLTVIFKQAVKEMAFKDGLLATFMGRPFNGLGGSGYHLHVSLREPGTGKNVFADPDQPYGLSRTMLSFIAGQLVHAKGTMALMAPTVNSYKRYQLFSFAPYYVLWGLDNRSTYVRVPAERGSGTRVENRAADAAANPYLVIAAVLASGLDGIEKGLDPGDPYLGDCYQISDAANYQTVPRSLGESLDAMEGDDYVRSLLGPEFIKAYLAVKRMEYQRFLDWVTDWEFNEYPFYI